MAADAEAVWRDTIRPELVQSEKVFVVIDNYTSHEQFTRSQRMDELLRTVVSDLIAVKKRENPGVIVIASSTPAFNTRIMAQLGTVPVRALKERDMVRALRYHFRRIAPGSAYDTDDLKRLAIALQGYPMALGLAVAQVAERGFELVLTDMEGLHKLLVRLAQELVAGIPLSKEEKRALILLATAGRPLDTPLARAVLGQDFRIVDGLIAKQLLDLSGPGYAVHGILQTYVLESMASPDQIKASHGELAKVFRTEWERAPGLSAAEAEFGSLAYFHTMASGQQADAQLLKLAYIEEAKEAAVELYRRGEYGTALVYLDSIRKMEPKTDPVINFYYGLTLNRVGKSGDALPVIQMLIDNYPTVSRYYHAKGSILRRLERDAEALVAFRQAVAASQRRNVVALASLADQLCQMGIDKEALAYAKEAYALDPGDSQTISVLVHIHHKMRDLPTALRILEQAIRRRRTDTRLHARAGIIAKDMGDFVKARDYLTRASSDPFLPHTITALADVYIELGDLENAEKILGGARIQSQDIFVQTGYWSTKANIFRLKKLFPEALECIRKALNLEKSNPVHHGGSAQLHLDMARQAMDRGNLEGARLEIELARADLNRGLLLDPNNEPLRTIQEKLQQLEVSLY